MENTMLLLEVNHFGLKEKYCTLRTRKLHKKITEIAEQLELGISKKEIQTSATLQTNLNKIGIGQFIKMQLRSIQLTITKVEFIKK